MKFKQSISWDAEKHPEITGKVRVINEDVKIKDHVYRKVYVLVTENAVVEVLGSTVLDKKMENMNVQEGETIRINFLGMKKGDKAEYKDFEVSLGVED